MPTENTRSCPTCATAIPASFPEGFCPKCMLASVTPAAAMEVAEGDKTIAVPAPTPSQMLRPGGVPSVDMLRRIFPDLEILDVLGAGGMGAVYKARQPRLNRLVALKIMVAAPGHEGDFALRFEREAQVLARLSHPHIVILYDFGELSPERTGADPLFYFLMEYVDGTDLGQLIKSKELKPAQALAIVPQICEALQYAHDQGITHRDIKPANILIDKRGTVKIADFGLAKMISGTDEALMTGLTQTGTAMGTPHYMAPEQWDHPELVDHRADIYALGVVFYEMLTGERPAGVFEPPSKKTKPPVDKKLDVVVMRAMDKNPDRRYQQAGQIGDDVTRISGANKSRPATTKGTSEPKRSSLKPLLAIGIAAALAVGGWMLWQGGQAGPPAAAVPPNAALGGPSVLPNAKPGRLRAAGATVNGKPHDLTKFAAYGDFVDVAGGWSRWVALRANGQTVSSDGKADFTDIAKIAASFNAEYAFITKAGKLVIPDYEKWTLPSELGQGVVDAALGMQHGIALLDGGRAVVFGARYDGTVGDPAEPKQYGTPRWPLPEAHALEKVQAVAATVTHAATLHEDGTLSLWGWQGPLKWESDPRQKPLRQLRSTQDGFWALDEAGQLWHLPVPRNPAPGQPVYATDKPSLSESGVTHLGPRCWRRKSGEWIANMNTKDCMDLMKAAGISESTAFSLDGGLFNGKPSASLLWIEPVTEGRAAGPPAAAVPPQTALGGPSALPIAKPGLTGRLRGAGFHLDGKPLDLKNAEGITDFVQVILTDRGWVGLRANGELVTPEAGLGEKNIARLLPSWFNSYGTIDREGRLSIQRPGSEGVKAVPEEVQRIGVVDACWDGDGGQAIALLKDGSVRVWGEHYTTGYKDTPVWPAPPTETLQNVRKIAITHWRAATLRQDGKWHIWGGHGGSSGPFDLQPFERWGEIADIETTYEPFRVLTRSGQVYNLGGSRPLTTDS